jgi:DNA repair photolyase
MQLIKPFDPWKGKLCTCPPKYSISPYTGCSHGCIYCYARTYIRNFDRPTPKTDFLKRIERELKKLSQIEPEAYLTISNSSDPYQVLEKDYHLTRSLLEMLVNYRFRVMIVTKSDLVARDLDILERLNAVVVISITTLNSELSRKLEPQAPSPDARLKTLELISSRVPVIVRFDPLIFPITTDEIPSVVKEAAKKGIKHIVTSTLKVRPAILKKLKEVFPEKANILERLYRIEGEKKGGYTYIPKEIRKELLEKVCSCCKKEGITVTYCREGFPLPKELHCDGSHLFITAAEI